MPASLSLRERRLIAVALLLGLVLLLVRGLIMPVLDGFSDRAAEREALLQRYALDERAVVQMPSARRAAVAQRRDAARFRLAGATATLAADALKERLGAAVTASGGEVRAIEDVAARPGTIRVRADTRLTTSQLTALLASLQNSAPLLVIENLTVAADQALQTGRAGPMDVRLEVSGLYPVAG
jgi:general secretion pathway protein M